MGILCSSSKKSKSLWILVKSKLILFLYLLYHYFSIITSWAFSTVEPLEDRWCLATKERVLLSAQYMVSCDTEENGCKGGETPRVFKLLENIGTVSEECVPYQAINGTCMDKCTNGEAFPKMFKCQKDSHKQFRDVDVIKRELMINGPMHCAFHVYSDFKEYRSGIYYQVSDKYLGGHGIQLVGWGWENGINYWIMKNSWVNN